MHRLRPWATAALLVAAAGPLAGQNPECSPYSSFTRTRNVCNAAVDGSRAFQPIVGLLTSGGNPVLGTSGALGGLGHFSLGARVNATEVVLPDPNYDGATTTVGKSGEIFLPSPLVEGAVGVLGGPLGLDLLGAAQLLPTGIVDNLTVDPNAARVGSIALGLGVGARLSLLQDRSALPGVSVSLVRRSIPRVQYGDVPAGDQYSYAADLRAWNLRATVGKRFSVLALAAGVGQDWYDGSARIQFRDPVTTLPAPPIDLDLSNSRTVGFVNAGLQLRVLKLVAEAGYQLGKDQGLTTTFTDFDPKAGRFFAGAGLMLGL